MKFYTEDNKFFETMAEAEAHEKELADAKKKEEKKAKEKKARRAEVDAAFDAYQKLADAYAKDYGVYSHTFTTEDLSDVLSEIFGVH